MKKMAKILLIGLGFGLVTAVLGFLISKPAPAQSSVPVTVVVGIERPVEHIPKVFWSAFLKLAGSNSARLLLFFKS